MSLFNKPKRNNIRRRPFNIDDDNNSATITEDNENRMEIDDPGESFKSSKSKKKEKPKQTLLSFGEELEEGEDKTQFPFYAKSFLRLTFQD